MAKDDVVANGTNGTNGTNGKSQDVAASGQQPQPRLCHVVKVDTFDGYGFNLLAEQGRPGQFIGKVDEGSPAEAAGLRQGDRILEVNGASIAGDNHKQVVQKIKAVPGETRLLVVTPADAQQQPSPAAVAKAAAGQQDKNKDKKDNGVKDSKDGKDVKEKQQEQSKQQQHAEHTMLMPEPIKLNLGMTAAEMRAQLAARKKQDPKATKMDFKSKFDLVQKL